MADLSLYTGIGRLTRDAEVKTVPSGKSVTQFTVASNPSWNREDPALFMDCQLWGERGSKLSEYLKRGSKVCVHGTLKQESWTSNDGSKKVRYRVDVTDVSLLDSRKPEGEPISPNDIPLIPNIRKSPEEMQIAALFGSKNDRAQASIGMTQKPNVQKALGDDFDDDIPF
jgi:single-strand DNA-binding protein